MSASTSSWSTTAFANNGGPFLTSEACVRGLADLMKDKAKLAVAAEASSHPSGLVSLFAQPWVYAGGGLGNYDECPMPLHVCLAGGTRRDSITFASVCLPAECTAQDVHSPDYLAHLERVAAECKTSPEIANEYFTLQQRIASLNKFLNTGWTCGNYKVPYARRWGLVYASITFALMILGFVGTYYKRQTPTRQQSNKNNNIDTGVKFETQKKEQAACYDQNGFHEEKKDHDSVVFDKEQKALLVPDVEEQSPPAQQRPKDSSSSCWVAWNLREHYRRIGIQRQETACLDGLRVGSILWIILGHVMAIQSSTGGGYSNPKDFLPPHGLTTTLGGQLLFSSRFAVDTFLLISGYLAVHVLRKLPMSMESSSPGKHWFLRKYLRTIPGLLLHRILRIMPLYGMTLGFWMLVAPHLGGGPFWYQWQFLLQPCVKYGWTNWLFVNNFIPTDLANTDTCFYHSWYLAIDVQLFLVAPLLVWWFRQSPSGGKIATASLAMLSVGFTMHLSYVRKWSINTFDGAAVARFDVEGYAKPHIRAQAYLAGMLLAMFLPPTTTAAAKKTTTTTTWQHTLAMALSLLALACATFCTVTGAYSRRPCRYEEWPTLDECGSTWSPTATYWFSAVGRAVWSVAVAILLGLCLKGHGGVVGQILSWNLWTPLSQLSFGAYLIHPIVIFVYKLGDTQKEPFSLLSFGINFISISVVSFVAALIMALLVEFPSACLQRHYLGRKYLTRQQSTKPRPSHQRQYWTKGSDDFDPLLPPETDTKTLRTDVEMSQPHYGSLSRGGGVGRATVTP